MISRKTLGLLAGILVVLGLLSTLTGRSRYSTTEGGGFVNVLEAVDTASIETIRAWLGSAPEEVVELGRSGDGWVVPSRWDWKAKDDLVQRLLDDVADLRGERRASSEEVLADFQADEENGLHVVASGSGGTELFHLVVGKTALQGGAFVRTEGSNDVYLTQAALRSSFGVWGDEPSPPDAKRWIELRVHQADRQDVDRIVVRDGGRELALEKEFAVVEPPPASEDADTTDTETEETPVETEPQIDRSQWTWKADAAGEFDKSKVDGLLGTLCSLYAFDVADPESLGAFGLTEPERSVEVLFEEDVPVVIHFGGTTEDGKQTYFRMGEDGKPALIYTSTVDRIFQDRDALKPQA